MMINREGKSRDKRRGVAVVIVVGMLSVMMLTAVAFSISMRIERRGAANYRHSIQARHMMWAALADCLGEINGQMDGSSDFYVSAYNAWGGKHTYGSAKDVDDINSVRARVLSPSILELIPEVYWDEARSQSCYWQSLRGDNQLVGRYAFLAIDLSGLLDASYAGGTTNLSRNMGLGPEELQFGMTPADAQKRELQSRYEVVSEFKNMHPSMYSLLPGRWITYSRAVEGERLDLDYTGTPKTNISYTIEEMESGPNRAAIKRNVVNGLLAAGVEPTKVGFVYTNLLDYLDKDSVPRGLDQPFTEATPLLSEFRVGPAVLVRSGNNISLGSALGVEWHYPFVRASSNSYDVELTYRVKIDNLSGGDTTIEKNLTKSSTYLPGVHTRHYAAMNNFVTTIPWEPDNSLQASNGVNVKVTFQVMAKILESGGGAVVDQAPYSADDSLFLTIGEKTVAAPAGAPEDLGTFSKEVVDPRFNWTEGFWNANDSGGTLGAENKATSDLRSILPGWDLGTDMHVENGGSIKSVGELGYLLQGPTPQDLWRTIRLYSDMSANPNPHSGIARTGGGLYPKHNIFKALTVGDPIRHGLINLNGADPEALRAVFTDCPVGDPYGAKRLTDVQVDAIVDAITNAPAEFLDYGQLGLEGQVDWCDIPELSGLTDLERESILINSAGMMTVRENMFLIVLKAESFSEGMGGERGDVLSASTAIAEIWRDPYRDSGSEKHNCFIRYFRVVGY